MGKDDKRRQSVSYERSSYYPGDWTKWKWDKGRQRWSRYRDISKDEREVEYRRDRDHVDEEDREKTPKPIASVPREVGATIRDIPPVSSHYSNDNQYTTRRDSVSANQLASQLEDTRISTPPLEAQTELQNPRPQANVTTQNPYVNTEKFDSRYKVQDGWHFKFGKVFKMLWAEPTGDGDTGGTAISERENKFGEVFIKKVRRFVVIDKRRGHCICLPIMTYGGQGCGKRGVQALDHAIIHTSQPVYVDGEPDLTKLPILVEPINPQHRLDPASRLNYAKVYTIEFNVKVWFIGKIAKDSEWKVVAAYNDAHPPIQLRGAPTPTSLDHPSAGLLAPPTSASMNRNTYAQRTPLSTFSGPPYNNLGGTSNSALTQNSASMHSRELPVVAVSSWGPVQTTSYTNPSQFQQPRPAYPDNNQFLRSNPYPQEDYYSQGDQYSSRDQYSSQEQYRPQGHFAPREQQYPPSGSYSQGPYPPSRGGSSYQGDNYQDSHHDYHPRRTSREDDDDLYNA